MSLACPPDINMQFQGQCYEEANIDVINTHIDMLYTAYCISSSLQTNLNALTQQTRGVKTMLF